MTMASVKNRLKEQMTMASVKKQIEGTNCEFKQIELQILFMCEVHWLYQTNTCFFYYYFA